MIGSVTDYTHDVQPGVWRRYLGLLLDGLRAEPGAPSELKAPPLDVEMLDNAMCAWRPPRH
jgi:hypothetical protein